MFALLILPHEYLAQAILQRFTVRVHSRIVEKGCSWCRLWYFLRSLDFDGSGYVSIPLTDVCEVLNAAPSTVYQWLREGASAGAFRWWGCQRGILKAALGGLFKVTRSLGLKSEAKGIPPWGVVVEIPLHELSTLGSLRAAATAGTTQRLQQLSRYTAWASLPAPARKKTHKLPHPDEYFQLEGQRLSHDSGNGSIRCLIHVGPRRVFVSKGHIPYGTSQQAIARERGICDRTVQRHLKLAGVESKQLVQSKGAYRKIAEAMSWDSPSIAPEPDISLRWQWAKEQGRWEGEYSLTEPSGRVGKPHSIRIHPQRIFKYGDRFWLYRCNLYQPNQKLCTMRAAQKAYHTHTTSRKTKSDAANVVRGGGGLI